MSKDGGSAFPEVETDDAYTEDRQMYGRTYSYGGMTLRDYFAAKAMQAFIVRATPNFTRSEREGAVNEAWSFADAMLERRDAAGTPSKEKP